MRSVVWTAAALCWLSRRALCNEIPPEAAASLDAGLAAVDASDPQFLVYEVRQVEVVLTDSAEDGHLPQKPDTKRQIQEKERLLQRIDRKHGTWNDHHARHRLLEALRGFSAYADTQHAELNRLKGLYKHTSKKQKALLEREVKYSQKFSDIAALLKKNQQVCDGIVKNAMEFYGIDQQELDQHIKSMKAANRGAEKVSVSQALKHFVRDWAESGASERDAAFPCILRTLKDLFSNPGPDGVKALLPGAGVGRLGHEVANLPGFHVTNNEWSTYQNIAYRYLTHHPHNLPNASTIHPFVDAWSHHVSTSDMLRPISFPSVPVDPNAVLLVEGDFTTVFNDATHMGAYDVLVTHFFIDTARNLMSYFDTISRLLKPGGYWVNFGPLLYGSAPFVQLSLEEIVAVVERGMGFEFVEWSGSEECKGEVTIEGKRVYGMEAVYGFDERALTRNSYQAQFWVARKGEW